IGSVHEASEAESAKSTATLGAGAPFVSMTAARIKLSSLLFLYPLNVARQWSPGDNGLKLRIGCDQNTFLSHGGTAVLAAGLAFRLTRFGERRDRVARRSYCFLPIKTATLSPRRVTSMTPGASRGKTGDSQRAKPASAGGRGQPCRPLTRARLPARARPPACAGGYYPSPSN